MEVYQAESKENVICFVLTRYNLAVPFGRRDAVMASEKPWLDAAYLEGRSRLFEKYTLPSFIAQSDLSFKWIVMFHAETPEYYRSKIREWQTKLPQMEVLFLDDLECREWRKQLSRYLWESVRNSQEGLITVRVDNDDMIHREFIRLIKSNIPKNAAGSVLSLANGLQYDERTKQVFGARKTSNHFLSMYTIAVGSEENHIMSWLQMDVFGKIQEAGGEIKVMNASKPAWVEIIHETNVLNEFGRKTNMVIPYSIKAEYPMLELWNGPLEYSGYMFRAAGLFLVIWSKVILNAIKKKFLKFG